MLSSALEDACGGDDQLYERSGPMSVSHSSWAFFFLSMYNYTSFILFLFYIPLSRFHAYIYIYIRISVCVVAVGHLPSSLDEGRYEAEREGNWSQRVRRLVYGFTPDGAADEQLAGRWAGVGGSGAFPNLRQSV